MTTVANGAGREPIVITGTGIVSAIGCSVDRFHRAVMAGETGIRIAPWNDPARDGRTIFWGTVTELNPLDWMSEKLVDGTDSFAQFAFSAARQAMQQAGLDDAGDSFDPERAGVVHGTSGGGVRAFQKAQYMLDTQGPGAVPRKTQLQVWANMAAAQVALHYRMHGPNLTVTTACASSLDAIGTAVNLIRAGEADVIIAGGTEGGLTLPGGEVDFVPAMYYAGGAYGMEAPVEDPKRVMLPFDVNRQGIVVGEGSAMIVLERESHAKARGAKILGYLRGYGSLADSYHPSSPDPSGQWEARAMEKALKSAGMTPSDVAGLYPHATATPKGDTAEINAINLVHGKASGRSQPLKVAAMKGHTAHSGASSGGMSLIEGLMAMAEDRFPFTANTTDPDPAAEFEIVTGAPQDLVHDVFQVNSFGFGGQNASMIVSRS